MGGSLPDWELGRRKRVHSEEKSNKCKQCDITYLVAQLLMKTHNGEKSNQFSQCSAGGLDKGGPTGMGESHPDWELGRRGGVRCSYRMPSLECGIVADVLSGDQLYISANHISKERDGNDVKESGGLAGCQVWNAELRLKHGGDKKSFAS